MDSEEKKKPQNFCVRCGKPSANYRPFLCKEHDKELEGLCRRYPEFTMRITELYMRKSPIIDILKTLIELCKERKRELEKHKDEL